MEKLELDVALNAKQYYHFNLYHCYHSFNFWEHFWEYSALFMALRDVLSRIG